VSWFKPASGCNSDGSGMAASERKEETSCAVVGSKAGSAGADDLRPEKESQRDMMDVKIKY
jgi:hypothetical protein